MPQETHLERNLRKLGLSQDHHGAAKKFTFRVYFPRPPYGQVEYSAAKQGEGLNFVGQLLGHGGCTLKKIQSDSGTRVEVHDSKGNLNGTHPSYTDPSLHAVVFAETREKLNKAARLIAEVLQPMDATFEKFDVIPGGWALLKPAIPKKSRSPMSESSGQRPGGSSPSSDNGSITQVTDIDSAYVQLHHPWKSLKSMKRSASEREKSKIKVEKENDNSGLHRWNTWGHKCDGYCKFTTLTQNVVEAYAQQSRQMRKQQSKPRMESVYYDEIDWHLPESAFNGANMNASLAQFSNGAVGHSLEERSRELDGFPMPNMYEELTGPTESIITHPSRITTVEPYKNIHRHISLPDDL